VVVAYERKARPVANTRGAIPDLNSEAARVARELRRHDLVVELGDESFRKLKKSFEAADKVGARYLLIVGENEVAANAFALKHLASGEQVTVPRAELPQRILQKK